MRNKKLVIGIIVIFVFIGFIVAAKAMLPKGKGSKAQPQAAQTKKSSGKIPAKKAISKGKGALTVKILNYKNTEVPVKVKTFKAADSRSSVYAASTAGGRTQELLPGTYDIEVDTVPQKIFKNIKVSEGKETLENLGCITGSLVVKTINAKKALAYYPLRILYGRTNEMVTASMTNRPLEIVPGIYDIEIGTSPRQYRKDVKVEAGKEVVVDLGCLTGILIVKTIDENKKDVRCGMRITRSDTNEVVSSAASNKPVELGKGKYNIDVMTSPRQSKKDVTVNTAEEAIVEFIVAVPPPAPKAPAPRPQAAKARQ
jgi:hypothetical protein